jgi:flagellar biosynthetic protein FlhB
VILAGADLALTRYRFTGRLKMTKEEIKREYKEEEGDPQYKGQRKRRHREIIRGNFAHEVPKADVVVVNPTHIAVVLRYRPGEDRAPKLTAKGKGVKAENIRDLARQHGIPIVENIALARLLFKKVKVGRTVPAETFKAVAAILAFVYKAMGRGGSGNSASSSEARL